MLQINRVDKNMKINPLQKFNHPKMSDKKFLIYFHHPFCPRNASAKLGCVERNCCSKGVEKGVEEKQKWFYKFL